MYIDPHLRYRWDWLRGLDVVLLIDSKTKLGQSLQDIHDAHPGQIDVIDYERCLGWLILTAWPNITWARIPKPWVLDWLGKGDLHIALNQFKACLPISEYAKSRVAQLNELDPPWN